MGRSTYRNRNVVRVDQTTSTIAPIPYSELNGMLDGACPKGALNDWESYSLSELSNPATARLISCCERCPTPTGQLLIEHMHGVATRIRADETALHHRKEGYNFLILAEWMEHADNGACIALARETTDRMRQFFAPARYVDCLGDDETSDVLAAVDGLDYRCLQSIKTQYDLTNCIRMNQSIAPLVRRR